MGQAYLVFTEVFSIEYTVSGDVGKILEELEMFAMVYDLEDAQLDLITFSLKRNPMTEADRDIVEETFFTISDVGEIDGCNVNHPIPQKIVFSR